MDLTKQKLEAEIALQASTHKTLVAEMGIEPNGLNVQSYLGWLVPYLRSFEGLSFKIEASGSGDSGQIDSIEAENLPEELTFYTLSPKKELREWKSPPFTGEHDKYYISGCYRSHCVTEKITKSGEGALEDLFYLLADLSGVDWYNNEGGYVIFELSKDKLDFKMAQYFYEANTVLNITEA